ncbi:hypothetical protein [Paraburkholderia sp.]|uniref:hypothetical protein n=1 Tax=Paraburkholderia sp. TaxID=1926495 RepID=UPI0039E6829D
MDIAKLQALSTYTLRQLNTNIVAILRHRQAQKQIEAGSKLRIGGRATFVSRDGRTVHVVVDKINVKSANCTMVDEATGRRIESGKWRVAPSLLTPFGAAAGSDRPSTRPATW